MLLPCLRLPMFGLFGFGFLFFCTVLAVAVWLAFRSGEKGTTKLGGFAGCAIALALVFVAGLGALGCTAIALLNTPNELIHRGPVRSLEFHWDHDAGPGEDGDPADPSTPPDPAHAVTLRFELEGVDAGQVTRWIRDHTDGDVPYTITTGTDEDGSSVHLEVSLPISRRDLRRFREDFHRDFPDVRLPTRVRIELGDRDG